MPQLPEVNFILAQGGLGAQAPGNDYYSGIPFWCADNKLPDGFTTTDRIKTVFQIEDAEALGILNDNNDEVQATGTYLVTATGAANDVVVITVTETGGNVVTIGTYKRATGDTTVALVATGIKNAINALTSTTGYSASSSTATVTVTARKGLGIFLNSGTPIVVTITGTVAGTLTQFSGGVASLQAVWHYHIDRFFKAQPNQQGLLYLGFFTTPGGSPDFTELETLQTFANGLIKQMLVYVDFTTYNTAHFTTIESICQTLFSNHMPVDNVVYTADMTGMTVGAIAQDLGSLSDQYITVCIAQDGAAQGNLLYQTTGKSIGAGGSCLGTIAASAVSQSISEVGAFNVSDGTEYDTPAFATGELYRNISQGTLGQLYAWGYVFLRKFNATTIYTGSYWNSSRSAINITSDYSYIERNRTINKAIRGSRESILGLLSARIYLNADGTIQATDIGNFQALIGQWLGQMQSAGDLSGTDTAKGYAVVINPAQNVLATGKVFITIKMIPVAIGREISVTIGFVPKLS